MLLSEIEDLPAGEIYNEILRKKALGEDVVSLAIGEPSFQTPIAIIRAAYDSMKKGATHYTSSYGTPEVRKVIAQKVRKKNGIRADPANTIFLTTKLAVYAALVSIMGKAQEVLVPDPGYYYSDPVLLAGGRPIRYELGRDFSLDLKNIRRRVTRRTRAIIINTPSNPTGKVHDKAELAEVYNFCRSRGLFIISDESYEDLVYEKKHCSIGAIEERPEFVLSIFSLSKSYAMTGWRAGYAVAGREKIQLINRFLEHTVTCFPPFIQAAAVFAIRNGDRYIEEFRRELKERRRILEVGLEDVPMIEYARAEGAFYTFPRLKVRSRSTEFCRELLRRHNLALIPGALFGPSGEHHLRISFGAAREEIEEGTRRLRLAMKSVRE